MLSDDDLTPLSAVVVQDQEATSEEGGKNVKGAEDEKPK
jgi:hypothetical protein